MLHETQIGRDGAKPEASAISGKALTPEDAYIGINGYWVGVKARELASMTPAEQKALRDEWASKLPAAKAQPAEPDQPDYDAMTLDDLKSLATERGVDMAGRRSKEDFRQALRVADVTTRFTPTENTDAGGTPLNLDGIVGE